MRPALFEVPRFARLRIRSLRSFAPALLLAAVLTAAPAQARRLIEPGDALVATGSTLYVVRGDSGRVDVVTPRSGSGPNWLEKARGVVIDADRERLFAVTNPSGNARIVMIDPDTGGQTLLHDGTGSPISLASLGSGLGITREGELLVTTLGSSASSYPGILARSTTPAWNGAVTIVDDMLLGGAPGSGFGLAVAQTEAGASLSVLVSKINTGLPLYAADLIPETMTPVAGTPVQTGDFLFIPDVELNCFALSGVPICIRYWLETHVNTSGQCVSVAAAIFRHNHLFGGTSLLFSGAPLRCPVAIALAPGGDLMVLDGLLDGIGGSAHHLRLYRLTRVDDVFVPTLLASESELTDANSMMAPGLAVSTVAMPEPGGAGAGVASALGLALAAARRGRGRRTILPESGIRAGRG